MDLMLVQLLLDDVPDRLSNARWEEGDLQGVQARQGDRHHSELHSKGLHPRHQRQLAVDASEWQSLSME